MPYITDFSVDLNSCHSFPKPQVHMQQLYGFFCMFPKYLQIFRIY